MSDSIYTRLVYNVSLLLAMGLIYEVLALRGRQTQAWLKQGPIGVILGLIGIAVMLTPWEFAPGIVFDTRSVLLSIAGLFFGAAPTAVAMAMTAGFRLYQGGAGVWPGVTTILAAGSIGVAWRFWRRGPLAEISWGELYVFGVAVHMAVLLAMLTLPWDTARLALETVAQPVLVIYPLGTVMLGMLMANLLRLERTEENLRESEERYRLLFNSINDAVYVFSLEADGRPGNFIEANELAWRRLGYSREELLGLSPLDINARMDKEHLVVIMRRLKEEGQILLEAWHQSRDGRAIPVEINSRLFELKGRPTVLAIVRDITERQRAAEELAQHHRKLAEAAQNLETSRNMLQLVIESIPVRVFWKDRELRYLGCNSLFARDAGRSRPEELVGQDDFVMGWKAQADLYRANDRQVMESRRPKLNIIEPQATPGGGIIWLNTSKVPLQTPEGEVFGVLGVYEDITERKAMEEALRVTRENLELALKGADLGTWDWDIATDALTINERWAEMLGYGREEVEPHLSAWQELVHPEDRPALMAIIEAHLEGKAPSFEAEYRLRHRSGEWVWIFDKGKVIQRDAQGRAVRACGIHQDISQRKQVDEALRQKSEELETVLDTMPALVYIGLDPECRVITGNRAVNELFGFPANTNLSQTMAEKDQVARIRHVKMDGTEYRAEELPMQRAVALGQALHNIEFSYALADGRQVIVFGNAAPLFFEDGRVRGSVAAFLDVTKLKEAEAERAKLQEQLAQAQKMEAVGTLAGGIAHDFNNILWAIMGFTELSLQEVPPGSRLADNLQQVVKASNRAKDLVNQILTFSRKQEQEKKPLQIGLLIKEALKLLRATIPTTIEIKQQIDAPEALVTADPIQIHQLIVNLCANAAQAMREAGGTLEVSLGKGYLDKENLLLRSDLSPGPYVRLTVRDTGPGIPPEIMDKIFDPFFTTKEVGQGTGMGLAVVYGIVKAHGGGITVTSQPGGGASFTVVLPETAGQAEEAAEGPDPAPRGQGRLLVIDDEQTLVEMAKDMLENLGYEVTAANDSLEALSLLQSRPETFDLVITDQTMPHLTGLDLARELRRRRPEIPIILCTGFSDKVSEESLRAARIKELLMKPITLNNLGEAVKRVLDLGGEKV